VARGWRRFTVPDCVAMTLSPHRSLWHSLLIGAVVVSTVALARWVLTTRKDLSRASELLADVRRRRQLVGRSVVLPRSLTTALYARSPGLARSDPIALLILANNSCLMCQVELQRWNGLSAASPHLGVAAILSGADSSLAAKLWIEERLSFPLLADSNGSFPRTLGIQLIGTMRLLVVDNRISVAADGPDDGPIGFAEGVRRLVALE